MTYDEMKEVQQYISEIKAASRLVARAENESTKASFRRHVDQSEERLLDLIHRISCRDAA